MKNWLQIFVLQPSNISNKYISQWNVISSTTNVVVGSPLIEHAIINRAKSVVGEISYISGNANASVASNKVIKVTTWRMTSLIRIFQTIRLKWNDIEHDYSDVKREATNIHRNICFLSLFHSFTVYNFD